MSKPVVTVARKISLREQADETLRGTGFKRELLLIRPNYVKFCVCVKGCTSADCGTSHPVWETGQTGETFCSPDEALWPPAGGCGSHGN